VIVFLASATTPARQWSLHGILLVMYAIKLMEFRSLVLTCRAEVHFQDFFLFEGLNCAQLPV
jgi:hypothetical protein